MHYAKLYVIIIMILSLSSSTHEYIYIPIYDVLYTLMYCHKLYIITTNI